MTNNMFKKKKKKKLKLSFVFFPFFPITAIVFQQVNQGHNYQSEMNPLQHSNPR